MGFSFILTVDVILPGDESFPLDVDKPLDFGIILIIPVLMFPLFVTKDGFAGIHDGSGENVPMLFNVLKILVCQICAEGRLQVFLVGGFSQSLDVKPRTGLSILLSSFAHQADRHGGANEVVVSPAFISTNHCSRVEHDTVVLGAHNDIVNEMPVFRAGIHPRCLELVLLTEKCVSDGQVIFGALF